MLVVLRVSPTGAASPGSDRSYQWRLRASVFPVLLFQATGVGLKLHYGFDGAAGLADGDDRGGLGFQAREQKFEMVGIDVFR